MNLNSCTTFINKFAAMCSTNHVYIDSKNNITTTKKRDFRTKEIQDTARSCLEYLLNTTAITSQDKIELVKKLDTSLTKFHRRVEISTKNRWWYCFVSCFTKTICPGILAVHADSQKIIRALENKSSVV